MTVKERVWLCRLIEKMNEQADFSRRLGITNTSTFHGRVPRAPRRMGESRRIT